MPFPQPIQHNLPPPIGSDFETSAVHHGGPDTSGPGGIVVSLDNGRFDITAGAEDGSRDGLPLAPEDPPPKIPGHGFNLPPAILASRRRFIGAAPELSRKRLVPGRERDLGKLAMPRDIFSKKPLYRRNKT